MVRVEKVLLIIVLLLTLSAQAVAAVPAACNMSHSAHSYMPATSHHTHHAGAEHSHVADPSSDPASAEDSCCQPDGACSMGSCAGYSALLNTAAVSILQLMPAAIEFSDLSFASIALASLYRPPITH